MRVRYTKRAFADREAIFAYIERHSPRGAQSVKRAIANTVRLIGDFPRAARRTEEWDVLAITVPRYPYRIYYRVADQEIWILHIRHTSRQLPLEL
jgi:plasmid stabilization system protein ParE